MFCIYNTYYIIFTALPLGSHQRCGITPITDHFFPYLSPVTHVTVTPAPWVPHCHIFWTCFLVKSYDVFLGCAAVWQYTLAVAVPAPLLPRQLLAHCRTSKLVYLAASSCVKQYCILLYNRTNSTCTVLLYIQWSISRDIFEIFSNFNL